MKLISSLLIGFFSLSSMSYADQQIPCPALDAVKSTYPLLDTVATNPSQEGTFVVSTSQPVINDGKFKWTVYTAPVSAKNSEIALIVGKNNVRTTARQDNQNAYPFGLTYVCIYWSTLYAPVMAMISGFGESAFFIPK